MFSRAGREPGFPITRVTLAMVDAAKRRHVDAAEKLPAEGTQARRFGKTRSAQSTALLEDYVELIADLLMSAGEARPTDIARRLGVSHAIAVFAERHLVRKWNGFAVNCTEPELPALRTGLRHACLGNDRRVPYPAAPGGRF